MQIKLGTKVISSDDQQVGNVSSVILFPGTKEVTHLVVQKGQEATPTLVPDDAVYSADEKQVVLRQTAQDLNQSAAAVQSPPEGTVTLKEGAKVISSDGQNVGTVERVTTAENRIIELLLTKGKLLKAHKMIQTDMISSILENEVRLMVDAQFVNSLPEPRPETMQI